MNKKKLVLNILSVVFYVAALIGLFCPFIWQLEYYKGGITGGSNNGLEAGLNFEAFPQNLPNLLVIAFTAIGLVASIIFLIIAIIKYARAKNKKEGNDEKPFSNKKMLAMMIVFGILCGFVPFLCASLTLYAYGIAHDQTVIQGVTVGFFIGEGATVTAVGCLLGGICLYYAESGLAD